jgi:hypothetical protein
MARATAYEYLNRSVNREKRMRGCLLGGLVGVAVLASGRAWADENEAVWLTDYAEAKAAARQADKPMLVVFR